MEQLLFFQGYILPSVPSRYCHMLSQSVKSCHKLNQVISSSLQLSQVVSSCKKMFQVPQDRHCPEIKVFLPQFNIRIMSNFINTSFKVGAPNNLGMDPFPYPGEQ